MTRNEMRGYAALLLLAYLCYALWPVLDGDIEAFWGRIIMGAFTGGAVLLLVESDAVEADECEG